MAIIETADLRKRYGRVTALQGLTLSIAGGAVGLLGPNGAGKSSLIKIMLGLTPATGGTARILDLDAGRDGLRIRRQVGYMPENESFIPGLDAVTYVYLAARLSGLPDTDAMQRTHVVLNYVGLSEERYRPIESYSTGMKQKVKLAQALVHHPKLLLLDEPTSGLDPRGRDEMLSLIRDISRGKGIHVVLSTHILPDVEAVCDDAVILDHGRLVTQGAIARLRESVSGYDVRVRGDVAAFRTALAPAAFREMEDGAVRIETTDPQAIVAAAARTGVQLRHLSKAQLTLEQLFASELARSRDHGRS